MTWIHTIPFAEAEEPAKKLWAAQQTMYPSEYTTPVELFADEAGGIVAAHSLIPEALYHSFATFGALLSPDLPLSRRQHELIATVVSIANQCHY